MGDGNDGNFTESIETPESTESIELNDSTDIPQSADTGDLSMELEEDLESLDTLDSEADEGIDPAELEEDSSEDFKNLNDTDTTEECPDEILEDVDENTEANYKEQQETNDAIHESVQDDIKNNPKYMEKSGDLIWGPEGTNDEGFQDPPEIVTMQPGSTVLQRWGNEAGRCFTEFGTPYEEVSLPWKETEPRYFEILRPIESVKSGTARPWFNKPGGGAQYKTNLKEFEMLQGESPYLRDISKEEGAKLEEEIQRGA